MAQGQFLAASQFQSIFSTNESIHSNTTYMSHTTKSIYKESYMRHFLPGKIKITQFTQLSHCQTLPYPTLTLPNNDDLKLGTKC